MSRTTDMPDHETTFGNVRALFYETTGQAPLPELWREDAGVRSWRVVLRFYGRRATVDYYTGGAVERKHITAASVLDSLFLDATSYENARNFADFAADYGLDEDSRKAERMYKACGRNRDKLRKLLGDQYEPLRARIDEAQNGSETVAGPVGATHRPANAGRGRPTF